MILSYEFDIIDICEVDKDDCAGAELVEAEAAEVGPFEGTGAAGAAYTSWP